MLNQNQNQESNKDWEAIRLATRKKLSNALYSRIYDGPEYWIDYPEQEIADLLMNVAVYLNRSDIHIVLYDILSAKQG